MNRIRLVAVLLALAAAAVSLSFRAPDALAAAEVHRLNLVISAMPTEVDGGDFNKDIDFFNRTQLERFGLESLDEVSFSWLFETQLRYFVRPNVAVSAGLGQLRKQTKREYLPGLGQSIQLTGEVLSVPISVGGAYYLTPYNQGDFRAQAFLGAGVMSLVYNKVRFQNVATVTDTALFAGDPDTPLRDTFKIVNTRDASGWYAEAGVHMFFALRYSVMISGVYRSARIRELIDRDTGQPYYNSKGEPFALDVSGLGVRGAVAIGF